MLINVSLNSLLNALIKRFKELASVGGRTTARRKPYRNDTRKPSNRTRSKRIYKHKAIDSIRKQVTDKQLLNVKVIDYKYASDMK